MNPQGTWTITSRTTSRMCSRRISNCATKSHSSITPLRWSVQNSRLGMWAWWEGDHPWNPFPVQTHTNYDRKTKKYKGITPSLMAGFTLGVLTLNGETNPAALCGSMAHDIRNMVNRDTPISAAFEWISQCFKTKSSKESLSSITRALWIIQTSRLTPGME